MWVSIFLMLVVATVGSARARDCVAGEAPSSYVAASCSTPWIGGRDVCQEQVITDPYAADWVHVDCDLSRNSGSADAMLTAKTKADNSGYVFYGTDASGLAFCCAHDDGASAADPDIAQIQIYGTDGDDSFGAREWANTGEYTNLWFFVYGGPGQDLMYGPLAAGTSMSLMLGEEGGDTIHAYDEITAHVGGAGNDALYGDDDANILYGDDTAGAESGNDTIDGGAGND